MMKLFVDYELQRRLTRQYFSSEMNQDYDARDSEFATAVAAAAFAVYSIDQVELQYQKRKKESLENSWTRENKSRKGEITVEMPSPNMATRLYSNTEAKSAGISYANIVIYQSFS